MIITKTFQYDLASGCGSSCPQCKVLRSISTVMAYYERKAMDELQFDSDFITVTITIEPDIERQAEYEAEQDEDAIHEHECVPVADQYTPREPSAVPGA